MLNRGALEDARLEAKDTKKSEAKAKDSLLRTDPLETKEIGANVFEKKALNFFSGHLRLRKTIKIFPNFPRGFWRFPAKFQRFKK